MKTFTIQLHSAETNFGTRATYEFTKELNSFLVVDNNKVHGQPLGEEMAIFVTMMTKKEADNLALTQTYDSLAALATVKKSIKKNDVSGGGR